MPSRYISKIFPAAVETVTHFTEFLYNTSWLLLATFEITVARASQGYVPLSRYRYHKKYSENFVDYFPSGKNGMTESASTQKLLHIIIAQIKPFVEEINCY